MSELFRFQGERFFVIITNTVFFVLFCFLSMICDCFKQFIIFPLTKKKFSSFNLTWGKRKDNHKKDKK